MNIILKILSLLVLTIMVTKVFMIISEFVGKGLGIDHFINKFFDKHI